MTKDWEPKPLFQKPNQGSKTTGMKENSDKVLSPSPVYSPTPLFVKKDEKKKEPPRVVKQVDEKSVAPSVLFPTIARFRKELDITITRDMLSQYDPLTPEDIHRLKTIVREVDLSQTNRIIDYGLEAQRRLSSSTDDLMVISEGLTIMDTIREIVKIVESLDTRTIFVEENSFFGFLKKKQTPRQIFDQSCEKLDKLKTEVMNDLPTVRSRIRLFDKNKEESRAHYGLVTLMIIGGDIVINHYNDVIIPHMESELKGNDFLANEEVNTLRNNLKLFRKRIDDLKLVRITTMQSLQQVEQIKSSYVVLAGNAEQVISTTITLWKRNYLVAITAFESQDKSRFQNAVGILIKTQEDMLNSLKNIS